MSPTTETLDPEREGRMPSTRLVRRKIFEPADDDETTTDDY
jgi:hypothetical protein